MLVLTANWCITPYTLALALAVPLTIAGSAALARGFLDLVVPLVAVGALLWLVLGHRHRAGRPLGSGARS